MVVPRREIVVTDGPVDRDAIADVALEIQVTPAVALPTPGDGASADLVAADPVEALLLDVGIIDLVDEPVFGGLTVDVAGAGGNRLVVEVFAGGAVAVGQLPG